MRTSYLLAATALLAFLACVSAASPSGALSSYLSAYMSNGTISQYSYYNVSLNGSSYIVAAAANRTVYVVIGHNASGYSLLNNAGAITPVLDAYFAQYENLSSVSYLNTAMQKYYNEMSYNLTDCITETGINPPVTNTFLAAVQGCQSEPNCNRVLSSLGACDVYGPSGCEHADPFVGGLENLSISYSTFNSSINSYFRVIHSINASNAGESLGKLGGYISNISAFPSEISTNPLFPPPQSLTFSSCSSGSLPYQQPWYCVASGYCGMLSFNSTLLDSISSAQQQLTTLVPSKSMISSTYSSASAQAASYYMLQANTKANSATYSAFLNATYPVYNETVAEATALLAKSPNANLSASLARLKADFSAILANGVNTSIGSEDQGFNSILAGVISGYNSANATFAQASSYSSNYTLDAIAAQLNYRNVPPRLAELSAQLQDLDLKVGSGLNYTAAAAALPDLKMIGLQLGVFVPITTMGYLVKALDGWFINAMLAGSNASVPSKIASAPAYAALLSFLIGIILLIALYLLTYGRLSKRHRLKLSKKAAMAWVVLFSGLFIAVLVYTYATYAYAQAGTSFLPFAYFTGYLHSSRAAYIVLNGSSAFQNQGVVACASSIAAVLMSQNKTVKTIEATNYSCVADGTVSPLGIGCIDSALGAGTPVISLSASGGSIAYRGLYGTMMYASGVNATGSSCITAQLIQRT